MKSIGKETIFEFFDGKTTSIQRKMIEDWLQQPGHSELYYQYLDEWESRRVQFLPDKEVALDRYREVMAGDRKAGVPYEAGRLQEKRNWFRRNWFRTVGVAVCLLASVLWLTAEHILYRQYGAPFGKTSHYVLRDGTRVTLNANSKLSVPRFGFNSQIRSVKLEGEAEFDVVHTPAESRFVVEMEGGYAIEVLGTKFVALSREQKKRVYLAEGKVKMTLPEGRQIYMKPGHLFETTGAAQPTLSKPEKPQQYLAWKTQHFYFDATPLPAVVKEIEERFGVAILIADPTLENKELGGIYEAQSPDDLLQILTELYQIEISKNKNRIELRSGSNP